MERRHVIEGSARVILVSIGEFPAPLLDKLSRRTKIPLGPALVDPAVDYNGARGQYDSTKLVAELKDRYHGRVIGAAACDLFVPVLTFVFGEAEMLGRVYGLPPDPAVLEAREVRELWHEVGK